jgi:hypothetical protein
MAATTKIVSADYTIKALNGIITLDTPSTVLTGDLTVQGTTTTINSTVTEISDNVITLAAGQLSPVVNAGIEVDRGPGPVRPSIRWNETADRWEYSDVDGVTFHAMGTAVGGALFNVADDPSPELGGNLDVGNYYISNSVGDFIDIRDPLGIAYSSAPAWLASYAKLYANTPGAGGSGVFVVNTATVNDELITKSKALVYSIIF